MKRLKYAYQTLSTTHQQSLCDFGCITNEHRSIAALQKECLVRGRIQNSGCPARQGSGAAVQSVDEVRRSLCLNWLMVFPLGMSSSQLTNSYELIFFRGETTNQLRYIPWVFHSSELQKRHAACSLAPRHDPQVKVQLPVVEDMRHASFCFALDRQSLAGAIVVDVPASL